MAHPVVIELLPCINLIIAGHKAHFGRCDIGEIRNGHAVMNLLNTFIGPMIFLSIITGICGFGSVAAFGKAGKLMMTRFVADDSYRDVDIPLDKAAYPYRVQPIARRYP